MSVLLELMGRRTKLFTKDILTNQVELHCYVSKSKFLVLGVAGSVGQTVIK